MFSNRGWGWKLAAALALIAGMGLWSARRGDSINPALWRCIVEPARWNGTRVWVPSARILTARESEYEIETGEVRIRVLGRPPAEPGRSVSLAGIFRADGPRIEQERARVSRFRSDLRWIMELISVIVVLWILANFARHFLFRPRLLQAGRAP